MANAWRPDISPNQIQGSLITMIKALLGEMRRMMRAELEPIHERIDRLEGETAAGQPQNAPIRQPPRRVQLEEQWMMMKM
ncbi:hypothetical protein PanWU01x14_280460 [Parasponia andersonii]|uniref:Uncharacterized protein n=1 Tax=Parasponia andersonii TaxID=3476 RepID=A0A2P5B1I3_PARAD|nr:hypothetical protein PanWU01x14_280460 [Parasponia andersonii]